MSQDVTIRHAGVGDARTIAALHTLSWRTHYRGIMSDSYLDGPIAAERSAVWSERLAHSRAGLLVLVAESGRDLQGFVCVLSDHDPQDGSLVDNLHVVPSARARGLGRRLMAEAGDALQHTCPRRPVYLFVLAANTAAQAFYERVGGRMAGLGRKTEQDGSELTVCRYVWDSPAALIVGCEPQLGRP